MLRILVPIVGLFVFFQFVALNCVLAQVPAQQPWPEAFDQAAAFNQVASLVEEHFFKTKFDSAAWKQRSDQFRTKAVAAKSQDAFANVVNEFLGSLNTSHTHYYSKLDPRRYQLLSIFEPVFEKKEDDLFQYDGIGINTCLVDGKVWVECVFDGLPAAKAGLRFGDQILSVDKKPFHPILSFRGKIESGVQIEFARDDKTQTADVAVQRLDGRTMFETALTSSTRVIERNGKKVGYMHVWSYAGERYQSLVKETLLWGKLRGCDSLVLDLRDGWGGADVNYLNLFRPPVVEITSVSKDGTTSSFTGVWGKPVAVVTNQRSTSGKELFAFGFKKLKLGKLIGQTTAGAAVAGRCFLLPNGDALYLAVQDVRIDDQRLEGKGVVPDIEVPRTLQEASNIDPQLERALEFLTQPPASASGDPTGKSAKFGSITHPQSLFALFRSRIQGHPSRPDLTKMENANRIGNLRKLLSSRDTNSSKMTNSIEETPSGPMAVVRPIGGLRKIVNSLVSLRIGAERQRH